MQKNFSRNRAKKWLIRSEVEQIRVEDVGAISNSLHLLPVTAQLLYQRGYHDPKSAGDFICLKTEMLCDPMKLSDIQPAAERMIQAIRTGEKITIYGDYDVDGVTAVSTLYLYLKEKGADVSYYIPNRTSEGYGVSLAAIDKLAGEGTTLIITVDTGITAIEEVAYAKSLGVDFVVTDHHECRTELPLAVGVVNPHRPGDEYPFKELAGVGVIFKVICAVEHLYTKRDMQSCVRELCGKYADLVAIGTIADVMPVKGENKIIIKFGLSLIEKTERVGLKALMACINAPGDTGNRTRKKTKITSAYIGYTIAPRINAAGRIRSASLAADLFLTDDPAVAEGLAQQLCDANKERQSEENTIMQEAFAKIEEEHDFENDPVIILDANTWHHGVIGIVSSRITEHYGLPSILISFEGMDNTGDSPDDMGKGSGRSIKGMNLVDALVHSSEYLAKFGGHELAAGLSVKRGDLPAFRKAINAYAREHLDEEALTPILEADMVLSPQDVSMNLAEELQILEPFGVANPVPVFVMKNMELRECTPIGGGKHTRLTVGFGEKYFQAMCFSCSQSQLNLYPGDKVDMNFTLDINEYNGRRTVQLIVRDIRLSSSVEADIQKDRERFARIWAGESYSDEDVLPVRDDFVAVYTLVQRNVRAGMREISHRALQAKLYAAGAKNIGYVKLKLIVRILQELNLLGIEEISEEYYSFRCHYTDKKTDLDKSNLLRRLRNQHKQA